MANRQDAFTWSGGRAALVTLAVGLVSGGLGGGGCKKAPPPAPVETATEPAPTAPPGFGGGGAGALDAGAGGKPAGPIVTPKTADELGQRVVEALVAGDLARMKAYAPALDFIDRHCPEQADNLRGGYGDKLERAMSDASTRAGECAVVDWKGATLAGVTYKEGRGLPFYGCSPIHEGAADVRVAVGGIERVVTIASVYVVGDAYYLGAMPRCDVESPCKGIVKHVEELVAGAAAAPEASPLSEDQRGSMIGFCETAWADPKTREKLACLRGATSYSGIGACGDAMATAFGMWPKRGR